MSDKKISDLVELTTLASDDVLPVVDASANATKRVTYDTLSAEVRDDVTPADFTLTSGDMPAGSIVQVVNTTFSTPVTLNGSVSSYTDTGLEATITPTSNSNKIVVMFTQAVGLDCDTTQAGIAFRVLRNGSIVFKQDELDILGFFYNFGNTTKIDAFAPVAGSFVDAPSTTSAVTYKIVALPSGLIDAADIINFQRGSNQSSMVLMEVVA